MPKALHNAKQLPRLNPSRAVPRTIALNRWTFVGKVISLLSICCLGWSRTERTQAHSERKYKVGCRRRRDGELASKGDRVLVQKFCGPIVVTA